MLLGTIKLNRKVFIIVDGRVMMGILKAKYNKKHVPMYGVRVHKEYYSDLERCDLFANVNDALHAKHADKEDNHERTTS